MVGIMIRRLSLIPIIALFFILWAAPAVFAQDPDCNYETEYYPGEDWVSSATHDNIYGAPDDVWSAPIGTGSISINFPATEIESDTQIATYWTTKPGTTGYGSITLQAEISGTWRTLYTSSFQSEPTGVGRWQNGEISSYIAGVVGQDLTGIKISVTRQGGTHSFIFDAFRV